MDDTFTLDDLAQFAREEKAICRELGLVKEAPAAESYSPSPQSVQHVLSYSKALSVRDSKHLGQLEMLLN